ncbi:MAG: hypothetical protein A2031_09505 [Deltaproteobacteria bacterium RBG_19FT_COMBO_43_11]|nr:MAG: hypothetical protein A2031_09505 [Deltaproteobacteria bacterium RBG_19FT_COMBO_43_11]
MRNERLKTTRPPATRIAMKKLRKRLFMIDNYTIIFSINTIFGGVLCIWKSILSVKKIKPSSKLSTSSTTKIFTEMIS